MSDTAKLIEELRAAGDPSNQKLGPSRELYRRAAEVLTAAHAEIERLRDERDEALDDAKFAERIATKREIDANAERDAALATVDRLREALIEECVALVDKIADADFLDQKDGEVFQVHKKTARAISTQLAALSQAGERKP